MQMFMAISKSPPNQKFSWLTFLYISKSCIVFAKLYLYIYVSLIIKQDLPVNCTSVTLTEIEDTPTGS